MPMKRSSLTTALIPHYMCLINEFSTALFSVQWTRLIDCSLF